jgi:hypothetical protein
MFATTPGGGAVIFQGIAASERRVASAFANSRRGAALASFSAAAIAFAVALAVSSSAVAAPMRFVDATEEVGLSAPRHCSPRAVFGNPAWIAGGAAVEDFNNDGRLDILFVQGNLQACALYINQGDGQFLDEAAAWGIEVREHGSSAAAADYDNDGDIDIAVSLLAPPHILLVSDAPGHFRRDNGVILTPIRDGSSPSWGDANNDGRLELLLGQWGFANPTPRLWMYRPNAEGTLSAYSYTNVYAADKYIFGGRFADIDGDRLQDLLVVSDFKNSQVHRNDGGGQFRWWTPAAGTGADENGMGNAVGDLDNDGDLDWFVTSIWDPQRNKHVGNRLYRNRGDATFEDITFDKSVHDGNWGWGATMGDLDLDGDLDIYHVNGWPWGIANEPDLTVYDDQPARLYENAPGRDFPEVAAISGAADRGQGRGVAMADFDNDGDLDIFIVNNQVVDVDGTTIARELPAPPSYLRNDTARDGRHWLKVQLEGRRPAFHGHGIGSRVYVQTGGARMMRELHASTNFMCQEPGRVAHFGVGLAPRVDEVVAEWLNGDAVAMYVVTPDRTVWLPSPNATLSSRHLLVGEALSLDASTVEPVEAPRSWVLEGETLSDPAQFNFASQGAKEARLNIYEADGATLVRSEFYRLNVSKPIPLTQPTGVLAR